MCDDEDEIQLSKIQRDRIREACEREIGLTKRYHVDLVPRDDLHWEVRGPKGLLPWSIAGVC